MDINRTNLEAMFRSYSTAWSSAVNTPGALAEVLPFATEFPSSGSANFYAWMARISGFRKWVGDRVFKNVETQNFTVPNISYEDSVTIRVNDILDDMYGVYTPLVGQMGLSWLQLKRAQIIDALVANPNIYDGLPFFSASHVYGDYAIANYATSALTAASFTTAVAAIQAYRFQDGTACLSYPRVLVVPPSLRATAFAIVESKTVRDDITSTSNTVVQVDNPNYGVCRVVVLPEIATYANKTHSWFLLDDAKPVKPVCLQLRKEAAVIMDTDPIRVALAGNVAVMADGRLATAGTLPHLAYGSFVA